MITPAFTGQYYQDTTTKKLWKANSTTPGDWTAVGNVNKSGAGDPTGVETPDFTGQIYRDTATGNIWTSTGLTNSDWTLTVQYALISWSPTNLNLGNTKRVILTLDLTTLNILETVNTLGIEVDYSPLIQSINIPNLTQLDDDVGTNWAGFVVTDNTVLTTLSTPLVNQIGGSIIIKRNPLLQLISFPALTTAIQDSIQITDNNVVTTASFPNLVSLGTNDIIIKRNPLLTTLNIPVLVMKDGITVDCSVNALNLSSIDGILASCVSNPSFTTGSVVISLGTNAAPTQGAGSAHDILVARGVTITHN